MSLAVKKGDGVCLCNAGHGCLLEAAPLVPAMMGMMSAAEAMLEEAQLEARYCSDQTDALVLLAKRDALSELLVRLKTGQRNHRWARTRPQLSVGL
jgi:hypothetical protein